MELFQKLEIITDRLFPDHKRLLTSASCAREHLLYPPAPREFYFWTLLGNSLRDQTKGIGPRIVDEHYLGHNCKELASTRRPNEEDDEFRRRKYRYLGINQKRRINDMLLTKEDDRLDPKLLVCHLYVCSAPNLLFLTPDQNRIKIALQEELKRHDAHPE